MSVATAWIVCVPGAGDHEAEQVVALQVASCVPSPEMVIDVTPAGSLAATEMATGWPAAKVELLVGDEIATVGEGGGGLFNDARWDFKPIP